MASDLISINLKDEAATQALAQRIAPHLLCGDCFLLEGAIGAGKTAFSRALIRARLGRMEDVPSPTFTLVQEYEHPDGDIWHCDLYRLSHPDEAFELGLDDAFEDGICLVEWPDRLGDDQPVNASRLTFEALENFHRVTIRLSDTMRPRLHGVIGIA
jgi:tRNA threonylcarbamoyladenosine biosynthesis protein TsaE